MPRRPRGMPRRVRRARRAAVRRPRRQATTTVNRSLQPIPSRYICKMKYASTITTAAVSGVYQFRLNSLYDPDLTGIGHQPMAFDNLSLLYNKYRVISCGWRIQQPSNYNGTPIIVACNPNNDPLISWTNFGEMCEQPRTKYLLNNPGGRIMTLSGKTYLPKLLGRTKAQYMADDIYSSVVSTNPVENALLYVNTFSGQTGEAIGSVPLHVVLEYTVEWFDQKHILQS